MNIIHVLSFFCILLSSSLLSQTTFQYDIKGNQLSAIYTGDSSCNNVTTSSKDIIENKDVGIELNVFPNPFNERLIIDIEIKKEGNYSLEIYDLSGKIIATPIQKEWLPIGDFSREILLDFHNAAVVVKLSDNYGRSLHKTVVQIRS